MGMAARPWATGNSRVTTSRNTNREIPVGAAPSAVSLPRKHSPPTPLSKTCHLRGLMDAIIKVFWNLYLWATCSLHATTGQTARSRSSSAISSIITVWAVAITLVSSEKCMSMNFDRLGNLHPQFLWIDCASLTSLLFRTDCRNPSKQRRVGGFTSFTACKECYQGTYLLTSKHACTAGIVACSRGRCAGTTCWAYQRRQSCLLLQRGKSV